MDTFDPSAPCEKCGSDDITVTYVEERLPRRAGALDKAFGSPDVFPFQPERLDCGCRRCGFDWERAPIKVASR